MVPPADSIFVRAEAETKTPLTVSFFERSPWPRIFTRGTRPPWHRTRPRATSVAGLTASPDANEASSEAIEHMNGFTSIEVKRYPRNLGIFLMMSRNSGRSLRPARAFWPLVPRPEKVPRLPPRPTRRDFLRAVFRFSCPICISSYVVATAIVARAP